MPAEARPPSPCPGVLEKAAAFGRAAPGFDPVASVVVALVLELRSLDPADLARAGMVAEVGSDGSVATLSIEPRGEVAARYRTGHSPTFDGLANALASPPAAGCLTVVVIGAEGTHVEDVPLAAPP